MHGSQVRVRNASWRCGGCGGGNPAATRFCGHCGAPAQSGPSAASASPASPASPAMGAERRLVTALFADVSGFTSLADRVDSDTLHEIIAPLIRELAVVAERFEGTVAKYAGDAVLVFFGAPVAHEDDAQRALEVALEMHALMPRLAGSLPAEAAELSLHIGVNTGRVIADAFGGDITADYSILGDAVNVAQRLESVAPAGATYVGLHTVELTRDRFEFDTVPALRLKNKPEPVPAWRLVGRREVPVQRASAIVGRGDEIAAARAARREGRSVALVGPPGVGKTALLEDLAGGAPNRLATACLSYGGGVPYWPFADLLRRERGDRPLTPVLAAFADGTGATGLDLTPEAFQRVVHAEYLTWIRSRLGDGGLLTVEDLQWADAGSLLLLGELLNAGVPTITTLRPEAAPPDGVEVVEVGPLDDRAAAALLSDLLGTPPPTALIEVAIDRAGGNPLFVRELVRSLQQRGALKRMDGIWRLAPGWDASALPVTIERVLATRVDALSRTGAAVLSSAAVIGRRVPLPLLRATVGDDVDAVLDELVDAELLERADEGLTFTHALVQDVAYGRMPRKQRRELHERVADAGERIYGDGDDVIELAARHRYLGLGGPRAIVALRRAATRARRLHALEQVALHLQRAGELLRAEHDRADELLDTLLELAAVEELRGEYATAAAGYGEVRDRRGDVAAWRGLASTARRRGDYDEALDTVDAAFETLQLAGEEAACLHLERGWTLSLMGRWPGARAALEAGLAAADGSSGAVVGHLLVQLARVRSLTGDHEAAIADARRAAALFDLLSDTAGSATAARVLGGAYADAGDLDAAAATTQTAILLAERSGTVEELAGALLNAAVVDYKRAGYDRAIELNLRAIGEFERLGHGSGRAVGYGNLADTLLAAGRAEEAIEWSRRALSVASNIGHIETLADAGWTLARALRATGGVEAARAAATSAAAYFDAIGELEAAAECRRLDAIPS